MAMERDEGSEAVGLNRAVVYDLFYGADPAPILDFLVRWAGPGPFRVLDVGCGTGRVLGGLKARGWDAVGLEPDEEFRAAALRRGLDVRLGGFLDIDDEQAFDLVLAVDDPLQYVLSIDERLEAISRVRDALRPNGRFLVDVANFLWILENYREPQTSRKEHAGWSISQQVRHDIDVHAGTWSHTDTFVATRAGVEWKRRQVHRLSMFGFPELEWSLRAGGFDHLRSWPSYDAHEPGACRGPRIIVTCSKRD